MLNVCRPAIAVLLLAMFVPTVAVGQTVKAGVVTTLEGAVTARRVATPQPLALKFKDDVFLQDRISTGERSLARLLLGDKAVVTVRERSVFTVTETPGHSTVEVDSGKIGVAVARDRMRPGEQIEIRTPGAIVAVRGTVLVVDVPDAGAPPAAGSAAAGSAAPPAENVYVLRGTVEARVRPAPGAPPGPPVTVNPYQVLTVRGGVGTLGSFTPQQMAGIVSGLRSSGMQFKEAANPQETKTMARQTTTALVQALVGPTPGGSPPSPLAPPPEAPVPAETSTVAPFAPPLIPEFVHDIPSVSGDLLISGFKFLEPGQRLITFSGPSSSGTTTPFARVDLADVIQGGPDDLISVAPGADAQLAGALASVTSSTVVAGARFLDVQGTLVGTGSAPFLSFNPSTIVAPDSLIRVGAAGRLSVASQLVADIGSTFIVGGDFLSVAGDLTSTSPQPLLQFNASDLVVGTPAQGTSFFSLTGPAARATLAGPGFAAFGGGFSVSGASVFRMDGGAQLVSTPPAPFVTLDGVTVDVNTTQAGFLFQNASAAFAGGLLRARNVVDVSGVGPPSPLLALTASLVSAGGTLFDLETMALDIPGSFLAAVGLGSSLTVNGGPLLRLNNALLDVQELLAIDPTSQVTVGGPIAELFSGGLTSTLDLVPVNLGAKITSTSAAPLIGLTGSTLAVGKAIFGLRGRPGQTTSEVADGVTVTVGTDMPISHGGPWLNASASTLTADKALFLDTALLAASAPLLNLKSGSAFTVALDALDLSTTAKLTSVGPLIALDASSMTVNMGAVVSLNGSSLLRVTGDLFSLTNGSTLRTNSGPLVRVSGNSVLNVTGALAFFGGTGGNQLNVTNSLCGATCFAINGIPVQFVNGASSTNVIIGPNPLRNPGLGSLLTSGPNAAVILLDGPNSKVTITAP